jgi:hypothetical protein
MGYVRIRSLTLLVLSATLAFGVGLAAQGKPNFTGEWTLVADKSDFGPMPPPTSMTRTITHNDPALRIKTVQSGPQGETTAETTFSTDGKPTSNNVMGNPMTSTAKWDGSTLVINSKMTADGGEIALADRVALSDGGKTLTVTRTLSAPDGQTVTLKVVMTKKS